VTPCRQKWLQFECAASLPRILVVVVRPPLPKEILMNVSRNRFLLLTAALAGGSLAAYGVGCTIDNTNVTGDGGASQDASNGSDGSSGDDSSSGDSSTDSSADSATTDSGDGGAEASCDDTTGTVPDCNALADGGVNNDGGTTCASGSAFPAACAAWVSQLKPGVARNAVNCAVALPSCESGAGLGDCLSTALNMSCADPSANAVCASIASTCGDGGVDAGISTMQCDTYVSGMNQTGRDAITNCINNGSCSLDFPGCVELHLLP
jgi:hypothetical protein